MPAPQVGTVARRKRRPRSVYRARSEATSTRARPRPVGARGGDICACAAWARPATDGPQPSHRISGGALRRSTRTRSTRTTRSCRRQYGWSPTRGPAG
ncbi:hypothetical protein FGD71_039005 [Streptomyces sporangiiformans]|uniref:Uncharacterized protein n=1 Tax=Streptomyces sporangiiformans TaxID=2315329 RepID=A0A505D897_9ACTN|nr:hypothetical protein FGD71_039005 [Streptomyces sporangiiformans]